jgi:hypothetical protein
LNALQPITVIYFGKVAVFVMCFQWDRDWLFITCLMLVSLFVSFSDLSNNQITSIAGDAFHGLKSLTSL